MTDPSFIVISLASGDLFESLEPGIGQSDRPTVLSELRVIFCGPPLLGFPYALHY